MIAGKKSSLVDTIGGKVEGLEENEGRIVQIWVNCKGGLQLFAVYFWYSEGWTTRNEVLMDAVVLRTRDTPCPWLMACDANVEPETLVQCKWFSERTMIMRVPAADVSMCRSMGPGGVGVERMYDYVVACKGLKTKNRKVEVIEDNDSRPHDLVRFEVRCKKEQHEVMLLKIPKPLPGVSGGTVSRVGNSELNATTCD